MIIIHWIKCLFRLFAFILVLCYVDVYWFWCCWWWWVVVMVSIASSWWLLFVILWLSWFDSMLLLMILICSLAISCWCDVIALMICISWWISRLRCWTDRQRYHFANAYVMEHLHQTPTLSHAWTYIYTQIEVDMECKLENKYHVLYGWTFCLCHWPSHQRLSPIHNRISHSIYYLLDDCTFVFCLCLLLEILLDMLISFTNEMLSLIFFVWNVHPIIITITVTTTITTASN